MFCLKSLLLETLKNFKKLLPRIFFFPSGGNNELPFVWRREAARCCSGFFSSMAPRKTRGKTQHADQPSLKQPTEVFQAQQPSGLGLPRHHIKVHWQSVHM